MVVVVVVVVIIAVVVANPSSWDLFTLFIVLSSLPCLCTMLCHAVPPPPPIVPTLPPELIMSSDDGNPLTIVIPVPNFSTENGPIRSVKKGFLIKGRIINVITENRNFTFSEYIHI